MANYSTNEFRNGLKVMLDGEPCSILDNEFVKPGKGQAFNRVRLRNLNSGRVWERTFKSGESLEGADVIDQNMEYLYNDGEFYHFMDPDSFEQFQADLKAAYLSTGAVVKVPLFLSVGEVIKVDTRTGEYQNRVKS